MKTRSDKIGVIIVAAGAGQRMGEDKAFLMLAGKPLIVWSLDTCHSYEPITQIVLVLNNNNIGRGKQLAAGNNWSKLTGICTGGARRQDSVKAGLEKLDSCDWIIVHDGARPFLTVDLLRTGLESARKTGAAVAAVPVKDTIKLSDDNNIIKTTLERQHLWIAQTPQVFRSDIITNAYANFNDNVTDDAMLVEKMGYDISLYSGSYSNIKITTPEDMAIAEIIAKALS